MTGDGSITASHLKAFLFHREYGTATRNKDSLRNTCKKKKGSKMKHESSQTAEKKAKMWLEDRAANRKLIEKECELKTCSKMTFLISFDHDGRRMATLHGDHTVKIIEISTGRTLQTLVGHPRSPWTVDFHKTHPNILATGCLSGQVRIWDLSSGDCDIWECPSRESICSISLHPTAKILLIAVSVNLYIWNWETSGQPRLFASSPKAWEKVRWVRFDNTGDRFFTAITARAEYDWNILRQTPSMFEMNQQRMRTESAARARSHYQASLSANITLGEMLGNPLEISNDLLAQSQSDSSNMDVYHAATAYSQLHRIHTGAREERTINLSNSNYLNAGRSPRRPTDRENAEGRFANSPRLQRRRAAAAPNNSIANRLREAEGREGVSNPSSQQGNESGIASQLSNANNIASTSANSAGHLLSQLMNPVQPQSRSNGSSAAGRQQPSTSGQSQPSGSGINRNDTVFGVSLREGLFNSRVPVRSSSHVGSLATSRPPIRRPANALAVFEPNLAVEVAQQAERNSSGETEGGVWCVVLKLLSRLEGTRGPRRFSSDVEDIVTRLESVSSMSTVDLPANHLSLLRMLHLHVAKAMRRSVRLETSIPAPLVARLQEVISRLREHVLSPSRGAMDDDDSTDSDTDSDSSSHQPSLTDSSTNTEPVVTRSQGVSTNGSQSELATLDSSQNVLIGRVRSGGLVPEPPPTQRLERVVEPDALPRVQIGGARRSPMVGFQRIQRWRLDDQISDLDTADNVIIHRCKIHNDAGVDISEDGTLLAVLVKNPNTAHCPGLSRDDTMLRLVSLRESNLGDVLYQEALAASPVSLSISPLNGYILVGLCGSSQFSVTAFEPPALKFNIYKVPEEKGVRLKLVRSVESVCSTAPQAVVNCAKWLPASGQGLVLGTNRGNVIVYHSSCAARTNLNMNAAQVLDFYDHIR